MKSCGCRVLKSCSLHEAAPDMLGALKALVRNREYQQLQSWGADQQQRKRESSAAAWKRVEDAIRKAEGGA